MIAANQLFFDFTRPDAWLSFPVQDWNAAIMPIGVLAYLIFVPLFRFAGTRSLLLLVPLSSLLLSWATLGAEYTALLLAAVLYAGIVARLVVNAPSRIRVALGSAAIILPYSLLLLHPQPAWLPTHNQPRYFYLQWAGLAYLTLKALSVLFDAGRGQVSPPIHAGTTAPTTFTFPHFVAFLLFAPSLRMGPIYRYADFARDLEHAPSRRTSRDFTAGFGRILLGLLRLALIPLLTAEIPAGQLYTAPESLHTYQILLGLYLQPLSIFLWIAGYSDIAIGIGRLCGFRVPENFNFPWLATSIADFWRRWHISLSLWIRDYIYFPLGGGRKHPELNYLIVFLLVGLWHGLYPSYILWGLSQGVGLAVNRQWRLFWTRRRNRQSATCQWLRRIGLCGGKLGAGLGWFLTVNYQFLTIALFMDEQNAGRKVGAELLARFF